MTCSLSSGSREDPRPGHTQLPGPGKASGQWPIQSPSQRKCRYRSLSDISRARGLVSRCPGAESGSAELPEHPRMKANQADAGRRDGGEGERDPRSGQQPRGALQGGHGEVSRQSRQRRRLALARPAPCGSPALGRVQGPLLFGGGAQDMWTGRKLWHVPRRLCGGPQAPGPVPR